MKKLIIISFIMLLLAAITGNTFVTPQSYADESSGTVSGMVVDATTSLPIANVPVYASDFTTNAWIAGTTTDSTGNYTLELPAGIYKIFTQCLSAGLMYADKYHNDKYFFVEADLLIVTNGENIPGIDFSLEPGGVVSGTVQDSATSWPLNFVPVFFWDSITARVIGVVIIVDGSGNYSICLPPGTYTASALPGGYVSEFFNNVYDWDLATPITVVKGEIVPDINFSLALGGAVSGTVTDSATSQPIPNTLIAALDYFTGEFIGWGITQLDGSYSFYLPAGTYRIKTNGSYYSTNYADKYYQDTYDYNAATPVPVNVPGSFPNIDFSLELKSTISGTITDANTLLPIANIHVYATDFQTNDWISGTNTDANGNYVLQVPTGSYRVATAAWVTGLSYIDEFYNNEYGWHVANPVTVTAPNTTTDIDFSLSTGVTITGTVIDAVTTQPITNMHIYTVNYDTDQWTAGAFTDSNGNYTLRVPDGIYRVGTAALITSMPYFDEWYDNQYNKQNATAVTATYPDGVSNINFSMEASGTISGTITSENSTPVENAVVLAAISEPELLLWVDFTDSNGYYQITVPSPGEYQLHIFAANYIWQCYDNQDYITNANMVTISNGNINIDIMLKSGPGSVGGNVYEADGITPIPDVSEDLYFYTFNGMEWILAYSFVFSNPEGMLLHPYVKPGEYKIKASRDGYADEWYPEKQSLEDAAIVTVVEGQNVNDIIFTLSRYYETQPGQNIEVTDPYNSVTIVFSNIDNGGNTSVIATNEAPAPTSGFAFLDKYYDIDTEAVFSGNITVTLNYDDTGMTLEDEEALRLFHWNGSAWVDVTLLPVDTENNQITGVVTSLSWFSIGTPPAVTWLPPLSNDDPYYAKAGRTIPVKFELKDASGALTTEPEVILTVYRVSDSAIVFSETVGVTGNHYKVNVSTKNWEDGEYVIRLSLNQNASYELVLR
ncbi:MAG: hypothetical protein A2Z02_07485 [Chloroflexi bacterium RBG_16_48_7]|nr:MAG: hypothetical protein A2Z02_07485 [Chloroflexi bacterium RBG_16_48_7]